MLILTLLAAVVSILLILLPQLLAPKTNNYEKRSAYECGFEPFGTTKTPFDIHFYVVAMLFLIFDLEISYLFPWVIQIHLLHTSGFFTMIFFLLILTIAFWYEWQKGVLTLSAGKPSIV